jgi:hypothetical protein
MIVDSGDLWIPIFLFSVLMKKFVAIFFLNHTKQNEYCFLQDVDGEAALHLRRLSKKDPITKVSFHLQLLF